MASRAVASAAKKRKQAGSDVGEQPPLDRDEMMVQVRSRFPEPLSFMPGPKKVHFARQTWDVKGSRWKLLIGSLHRGGEKLPLFAYVRKPFWVTFAYGIKKKIGPGNLSTDESVVLLEPFCLVGAARRANGLEALILFYFVVRGYWDGYDVNPASFTNLDVLEKAIQTTQHKTTVREAKKKVEMEAKVLDTLEESVSSGEDPDEHFIFIKTCKQCRRMKREESHCRADGHITKLIEHEEKIAKQAMEIERLGQYKDLLLREIEVQENERNRESEDNKKLRDDYMKWKGVAESLLGGSSKRLSKDEKSKLKQELGITD